jgi:hypothetical protein
MGQVADYVRYYLEMHAVELGALPLVSTAASLFRKLCYENKVFFFVLWCFFWFHELHFRARCLLESFAADGIL